jgi:hypothetical protein
MINLVGACAAVQELNITHSLSVGLAIVSRYKHRHRQADENLLPSLLDIRDTC